MYGRTVFSRSCAMHTIARIVCKIEYTVFTISKHMCMNIKFYQAGERGSPLQDNNNFATFIGFYCQYYIFCYYLRASNERPYEICCKKKLRSRNFGADKSYNDYLFENCSSVKKTVLRTVFSCAAGALLRGPEGEKIPKAISDFGVDNSKYTIIFLRTEELYELL